MDGIKSFIFISFLFFACILNQAYFQGAFEVSEAREGVVVNEIKEFKTWVLPLRHGEVVPSKPPLFHWLTALITPYEQSLSNLGLRLVSILSGLICLICVYRFTNRHLKSNDNTSPLSTGAISAIILASTYSFIQMSIDGRVDMLFLCLILIPILMVNTAFISDTIFENKLLKFTVSILLGLAVLSRGPLALVTFYLCLAVCLVIFHKSYAENKSKLQKLILPFIVAPCLISAPWYLASKYLGKPELISRQLVFENVSRYFGNSNIISKPFYFYFEHIWLQAFPWSIICATALIIYFYTGLHKENSKNKRMIQLIGSQILIIILFLSSSSGKRKAYLLAVLPHISILTSCLIQELRDSKSSKFNFLYEKLNRPSHAFSLSIFLLCLCGISIILKILLSLGMINFVSSSFFLGLYELRYITLVLPLLFNLACTYVCFKNKTLNHLSWIYLVFIVSIQAYIALPSFFFLTKGESHSFHRLAEKIKETLSDTQLHVIKTKDDESLDSLLFYLGKRATLQHPENPFSDGTYIVREEWFNAQDDVFKNNSKIVLSGKRPADKDKRKVIVFKFKVDAATLSE